MEGIETGWRAKVLLLFMLAKEQGISNTQIAKQTGLSDSTISRLSKLKFCPTLKVFMSIAHVVGVNYFFESKDSDSDLNELFSKAMDIAIHKRLIPKQR